MHGIEIVNDDLELMDDLYLHSLRVSYLSFLIAKTMNLKESLVHDITLAGLFHDIGKLKIDKDILNKKGKLNVCEWYHIKQHPIYSEDVVSKWGSKIIMDAVRHHHESEDGSGYPDGLYSTQISIAAKIIKIADVYDALTSKRVYRLEQYASNIAINMIKEDINQFDSQVFIILTRVINQFEKFKLILCRYKQ